MSTELPRRVTHPIPSYQEAIQNFLTVCAVRGYCGPFVNQELYDRFPDPMWRGYGECVICCSTCRVADEEAKRRQREGEGVEAPLLEPPTP